MVQEREHNWWHKVQEEIEGSIENKTGYFIHSFIQSWDSPLLGTP